MSGRTNPLDLKTVAVCNCSERFSKVHGPKTGQNNFAPQARGKQISPHGPPIFFCPKHGYKNTADKASPRARGPLGRFASKKRVGILKIPLLSSLSPPLLFSFLFLFLFSFFFSFLLVNRSFFALNMAIRIRPIRRSCCAHEPVRITFQYFE